MPDAWRISLSLFLAVCGAQFLCRSVEAASFDCTPKMVGVEAAICADPNLSAADDALAKTYKKLISEVPPAIVEQLRDSQRTWIKYIRTGYHYYQDNASTISEAGSSWVGSGYRERIETLENPWRTEGNIKFFILKYYNAAPLFNTGEGVTNEVDYSELPFQLRIWSIAEIAQPQSQSDLNFNRVAARQFDLFGEPPVQVYGDQQDTDDEEITGIISVSPDLIQIEQISFSYSHGAAHDYNPIGSFVWLRKQGRLLRKDDIFDPKNENLYDPTKSGAKYFDFLAQEMANDQKNNLGAFECNLDDNITSSWIVLNEGLGMYRGATCRNGPFIVPWGDLKAFLTKSPPFSIPLKGPGLPVVTELQKESTEWKDGRFP